jgi:hypothetical protein
MTEHAPNPRKYEKKTRSGRLFEAGNPGRLRGSRNKATVALEALLDGEAEAVTRKTPMALDPRLDRGKLDCDMFADGPRGKIGHQPGAAARAVVRLMVDEAIDIWGHALAPRGLA